LAKIIDSNKGPKQMPVIKKIILLFTFFISAAVAAAQQDTIVDAESEAIARMISLSEVVVNTNLKVPAFLQRVKNDTTFYKAFRNLHLLGYTSLNDIRMKNKKDKVVATLQSKTKQNVAGGCRTMDVLQENAGGNFYDANGNYNYYTAEMYAGLFFTKGKICGENNTVKGIERNIKSKKGIEKNKEQLKMLFFNPGSKIKGIPLMGDKVDIFDQEKSKLYDFTIDNGDYEGESCYIFSASAKPDLSVFERGDIVIDNMKTWFSQKTFEVLARNYDLSYRAAVYDFDVHMEVQLTRFGKYVVPKTIRYTGNWDVAFKKRERGVFTATLFDFTK
jgi:hypothetical protein